MSEPEDTVVCAEELRRSWSRWFGVALCWCLPVIILRVMGIIGDGMTVLLAFPVVAACILIHYRSTSGLCPRCGSRMGQEHLTGRVVLACHRCGRKLNTDAVVSFPGGRPRKAP